jgi:hypothetical protein
VGVLKTEGTTSRSPFAAIGELLSAANRASMETVGNSREREENGSWSKP